MKLTVRRIKLNSQGYNKHGFYWGAGERLYCCPEISELREATSVFYVEGDFCRAPNQHVAREIFKARAERMLKHPKHVDAR